MHWRRGQVLSHQTGQKRLHWRGLHNKLHPGISNIVVSGLFPLQQASLVNSVCVRVWGMCVCLSVCLLACLSQTMPSAMTTPSDEGGASTPQEVDGEADRFLQVFTCNMATRREVSHVKFRRDFPQKSVKCPRLWNSIICRKQYSERFSRHFVITRLWKSARKDLVIHLRLLLCTHREKVLEDGVG